MEKYNLYKIEGAVRDVHYWQMLDSGDGLKIQVYDVKDYDSIIDIFFKSTLAYTSIDEGNRLELWSEVDIEEGGFIYVVENSKFLEYFHKQSKYTYENEKLKHYFIKTTDDCFDVISQCEIAVKIK